MPNQRGKDQKLIAFPVKSNFEEALENGLRKKRVSNKSQFIRDAIYEKLGRLGISIPAELKESPPRYGNSSSKPDAAASKALKKVGGSQ